MDAWRTRVIEIRVFGVENAKRRFSDREEGDHLAFEGEIGPRIAALADSIRAIVGQAEPVTPPRKTKKITRAGT